ncbi:MAG TPA: isoprenyl transferase [Bacteroidales bacterium]|nr:isoprenyl transferase [Bacteroidales bacterium]HOH22104.1 isoprenyl transferase [Bacteroidales bacterium]HPZ03435.1 isoprenyl transferase [Bacteroidales bacterium]HQB74786.1 isoprenyl transferase [Bacteroidales bacterium]
MEENINIIHIPTHVAIIMDGNGRWAQAQGEERIFGHQNGVQAVRNAIEAAAELGVKYLTLYTFSTENWNRPKEEIDALMDLLISAVDKELDNLMKNQIRLKAIGNSQDLPKNTYNKLSDAIEKTKHNKGLTVVLALSYSARWELTDTMKRIGNALKDGSISVDQINENLIQSFLCTRNIPDPDILIRTGKEQRISNFLLWQIAYTELFFLDTLWPDFTKNDFLKVVQEFQTRERRFGKISEQLISE